MRQWLSIGLSIAEQALFPTICLVCSKPGQSEGMDLCTSCEADLPINGLACVLCAQPLAGAISHATCGACLRRPPQVIATYCAYRYGFPTDHLLRGLKYGGQLVNARVLGGLLAAHLSRVRAAPLPDCVIPVPLAGLRFHERGFNQSIEIGRTLASRLGLTLRTDVVERIRETPVQAGLDRIARRKNLRNAFAVRQPLSSERVAILDDVVTTGSTANELARTLLRAGAQSVELWAVAKVA